MALALYPWQQSLVRELLAVRENLPNGILVHGPRGIGTFDAVHEFAKSLLCVSPLEDGSACGHCKGCLLAKGFNHPDIRYVVSETEALPRNIPFEPPENATPDRKNLYREILIHQTRALSDFLSLTSHEGGRRVVLVYPADLIRAEAAASLLKSLEEPPENLVFILVADEIDRVLPTIRSRCRLIRALPPPFEEALSWLQQQGLPDAERKLIAAGGRPLIAMEGDARLSMAPESEEKLLAVLRQGAKADNSDVISAVGRDATLPSACLLLSRWGWDLAAAHEGIAPRFFPQHADVLRELAAATTASKLYPWLNSVRDVRRVQDHTLAPKLILEQLLLAYVRIFG